MRKFILFAAAVVCTLSMSAKTIYLNTGGGDLWNKDGAVFFAHSWASEQDNADVQLTNVSGDIFSGEINDGHNNILFVRLSGGSSSIIWDGEGKNVWNKTADLAIPNGQNQYNITGWGDKDGNWSVYGGGGGQGGGEGGGGGSGGGQSGDKDYYLKGYRGPNQGDITTPTAEEQFESGILSYTWEGDANGKGYFFVLVCEVGQVVGDCYMAKDYSEDTHCTLYKEDGSHSQKLGVKAPSATFYLYDNGDGTLELSTQTIPGKKLVGGGDQAIENVVYTLDLNAPMYDLLGRKVTEDYRGIVIQNGHKFIR